MNQLGERVAERRTALNLSQLELAELLGVTQGAVSHIERGFKQPSLDLLVRLQDVLGVPLIPPPATLTEGRQPAAQS